MFSSCSYAHMHSIRLPLQDKEKQSNSKAAAAAAAAASEGPDFMDCDDEQEEGASKCVMIIKTKTCCIPQMAASLS